MSDVFISHAREDRAACERLAEALTSVGLDVTWDKSFDSHSHFADQMDQAAQAAASTIVLWSRPAANSDWVKSEARRAFHLKPAHGAADQNRYVGLIADDIVPQDLPGPFNGIDTPSWASWFSTNAGAFDDSRFVGLLTVLERLTGRRQLTAVARALSSRDAETLRIKALVRAQDESLAQANALSASLDSRLSASKAELAQRDNEIATLASRMAELDEKHTALDAAREALIERVRTLDTQLRDTVAETGSVRALLVQTTETLSQTLENKQTLERELDDARSGMAAALRQQKTLQSQIEADDQTIQQIMTQREELLQAREKLERERARLTQQLGDAERRLTDSEQRRETYVISLVERKKEIDALTDKLTVSAADARQFSQKADALRATVDSWGHVPWRRIAAGSVAAGALLTAGTIFIGRAYESISGVAVEVSATRPADQAEPGIAKTPIPPQPDPLQPKSEAQVAPDTLQVVDTTGLEDSGPPPAPPLDAIGEISVPDETGAPPANDQVQFNPDGLPPVDPDSRPPPQDLPPMQQKPRLLLKPPVPTAPEAP